MVENPLKSKAKVLKKLSSRKSIIKKINKILSSQDTKLSLRKSHEVK